MLHVFQGIDYCFKPFPETIKTENTSERRRRLEHKTDLTPSAAVALLMIESDTAVASTYIQRQLEYCPENHEYLDSLIEVVPPREAVAILRPRLMQRPVDIDWHRAYQIMVGKAEPDHDRLYFDLARKLDYDLDFPHLTLAGILGR